MDPSTLRLLGSTDDNTKRKDALQQMLLSVEAHPPNSLFQLHQQLGGLGILFSVVDVEPLCEYAVRVWEKLWVAQDAAAYLLSDQVRGDALFLRIDSDGTSRNI